MSHDSFAETTGDSPIETQSERKWRLSMLSMYITLFYLGLDVTQFVRDIARKVYANCIHQDTASGMHSGVISAPALFVNSVRYANTLEPERLLTAIVESGNLL